MRPLSIRVVPTTLRPLHCLSFLSLHTNKDPFSVWVLFPSIGDFQHYDCKVIRVKQVKLIERTPPFFPKLRQWIQIGVTIATYNPKSGKQSTLTTIVWPMLVYALDKFQHNFCHHLQQDHCQFPSDKVSFFEFSLLNNSIVVDYHYWCSCLENLWNCMEWQQRLDNFKESQQVLSQSAS